MFHGRRHVLGTSVRRVRRVVGAVLVTTLAWGLDSPAADATEGAVFSGVCTMTLDVGFSDAVSMTAASRRITIDGGGTCVVNGDFAPMTLVGSLETTALTGGYSCVGGVATGTGVIDIETPGFPAPVVQLVAAQVGPVVTLTVLALPVRFDGVAVLRQDADDAAACPSTGYTTTSWDGAMPFQDPHPSPI